jgi:hypothetical protein
MSRWMIVVRDIWVVIFAASLLLSFMAWGIQRVRGKSLTGTRLMPVILILHFSWSIPFTLYVIVTTAKIWVPLLVIAWGGFMLLVGAAAGAAALASLIKRHLGRSNSNNPPTAAPRSPLAD